MTNVAPMHRSNPTLHNYNNENPAREIEFPVGITVSVLSWIVLAVYFGVLVIAVFAAIGITGIGIGIKHHRHPPQQVSCVPSTRHKIPEIQEQILKAA